LFTDAVDAGVRQAVILAAGLDARAYRLPWPDSTVVYEIDQPEVIDFKSKTMAELGAQPKADRRTVAIDLRNDWPKALCAKGFNAKQPTAWIAEGLLIYLPPEAQDLLFDRINDLSAPGSRVACEHIPDVSMFSDERSQLILERLKKYGHDFEMRDLIYHEKRNNVVDYLTGHGWDVTVRKVPDAYADNGFEFPEDGAMGFFTEMSYLSAIKR
jgi:methyltransferase (TIGR00027 family)